MSKSKPKRAGSGGTAVLPTSSASRDRMPSIERKPYYADEDHGIRFEQCARLGQLIRKNDRFDRADEILDHRDEHLLALAAPGAAWPSNIGWPVNRKYNVQPRL